MHIPHRKHHKRVNSNIIKKPRITRASLPLVKQILHPLSLTPLYTSPHRKNQKRQIHYEHSTRPLIMYDRKHPPTYGPQPRTRPSTTPLPYLIHSRPLEPLQPLSRLLRLPPSTRSRPRPNLLLHRNLRSRPHPRCRCLRSHPLRLCRRRNRRGSCH